MTRTGVLIILKTEQIFVYGVIGMRKQAGGLSGIDFLVIISFVAVLIIVFVSLRTAAAEEYDRYTTIQLEHGDTVLEIADEYRSAHELSDQKFVSWVEDANRIDANRITAGDTLIIPVEANATALGGTE
ncbi:hypothetical protein ATG70_1288 [Bacillus sp. es.036]|nr:hypothetical protein ATG70_1288 [Bacillus sp. es.036]